MRVRLQPGWPASELGNEMKWRRKILELLSKNAKENCVILALYWTGIRGEECSA